MAVCRYIRLVCKDKPTAYVFGVEVGVGSDYLNCRVAYARPNPCIVAPPTEIGFEDDVRYEVRSLDKNVLIRLRFPSGFKQAFIYPRKVWNTLSSRLMEPLGKGEPPKEGGVILTGAPGTGKTSMAKILSWINGLELFPITPESVMSKWYGETEKKINSLLAEAEGAEPSVVLLDDAEWLVRSRSSTSSGESDQGVHMSSLSILFRWVESWVMRKKLVITVITSNVKEELIDRALMRSGRLGRPVFIPLPDYEAVKTLLVELGIDSLTAEKYAVKIVNAGLSMADAVGIANDLLQGRKPYIEPIKGRGYVRLIPPSLTNEELELLKRRWGNVCYGLRKGSRLWFDGESSITLPLASSIVGALCKKPLVIMNDERRLDEVITTADTTESVLVVPHDYIHPDIIKVIYKKTSSPIIFCGTNTPEVTVARFMMRKVSVNDRKQLTNLLATYYLGKRLSNEALREIALLRDDKYINLLRNMSVFRTDKEELLFQL